MSTPGAITWTDPQQQAIETVDSNVLVSAAAGSGKTAVLAERCAHLVCGLPTAQRCSVDQLLVVTFTDAAASEMRTRIADSLRRRLGTTETGRWAQRQLALLDGAQVSTLHAFCHSLIRDHFAEARVDPAFTLTDADEAALLKRETLDALFDELYVVPGEKSNEGWPTSSEVGNTNSTPELAVGFRRLVDDYGLGRDDGIGQVVLRVHDFVSSLTEPQAWLNTAARRLEVDADDAIDVVGQRQRQLCRGLTSLSEQARGLSAWVHHHAPRWSAYADRVDEVAEALDTWRHQLGTKPNPARVAEVLSSIGTYKLPRAPSGSKADKEADPEGKARTQKQWENFRENFKQHLVDKRCRFSLEESRSGLAAIAPYTRTLVHLVEAFGRRYAARKRERAVLDFNDLERSALTILSSENTPTDPSPLARQLRDRFEHLLVDEFQDINPVQAAILSLVSRGEDDARPGNLFVVGDVKQSIYRFRLAEPEVFSNRIRTYSASPSDRHTVIHLRENFRSRAPVLAAINACFERLMSEPFAGLAYDETARLVHPDPSNEPAPTHPAIECHLLAKDAAASAEDDDDPPDEASPAEWEAIEREALLIGRRIRKLTGRDGDAEAMQVGDRPLTFRDIVILLRAPRHKAGAMARVLRQMGVPAFADDATGYFAAVEVRDMINLLHVLDNRQQDIPLASVLRSPVLGEPLSDIDLASIRAGHRAGGFHEAVTHYAEAGDDDALRKRVQRILTSLDDYRTTASRQPLADVIWRLIEETGYLAYVSGLPGGPARRANLLKLHQRARQFGRFARQGLHRFLRFIEQLQAEDHDFALAPSSSESDDVVRILSVHKSKGLEFPVVILAELGKQWNLQDARGDMIFERHEYIGLRVVEPDRGIKYPSLAHQMAADAIRRESLKEELRLLYVALTRARQRLILIGTATLDRLASIRQQSTGAPGPIPAATLESAQSSLEWIVHALAAQPNEAVAWPESGHAQNVLFRVHEHTADAIAEWQLPTGLTDDRRAALSGYARLDPLPPDEPTAENDPAVRAVMNRMTAVYEAASMTSLPAVVAASEMKRRFELLGEPNERHRSLVEATTRWERPKFLEGAEAGDLVGAERGTAVHLLLEHLDLSRPGTIDDVRNQLEAMVANGLVSPAQAAAVPVEAIAWFLATETGQRLRANPEQVEREVMFVTRVPPQDYDPDLEAVDSRDVILVRGIIDCLFRTPAGVEIIDYKTDGVTAAQVPDRAATYARQLAVYDHAVRAIWRQPVIARRLVFLTPRVVHDVP